MTVRPLIQRSQNPAGHTGVVASMRALSARRRAARTMRSRRDVRNSKFMRMCHANVAAAAGASSMRMRQATPVRDIEGERTALGRGATRRAWRNHASVVKRTPRGHNRRRQQHATERQQAYDDRLQSHA